MRIVFRLLLAINILSACEAYARRPQLGQPAPSFSAKDINGKPISLESFRGKVVLLDFWSTTCRPCIAEIPNMKKAYEKYKDHGFEIVGFAADRDRRKLIRFIERRKLPWHQVRDYTESGISLGPIHTQ